MPILGRRGEWVQVQLSPELRKTGMVMRWYENETSGWMHDSTVEDHEDQEALGTGKERGRDMNKRNAFRTAALTAVTALAGLAWADSALAQEPTFRLLTFEVGASGPRLGRRAATESRRSWTCTTRSSLSSRPTRPRSRGWLPSPPTCGRWSRRARRRPRRCKTVHDAITRLKASGKFTEPGGSQRVFYPERGIKYLPPIPNPSKVYGAAGAYIRKNLDGTPGAYDNVEYPSYFLKPPSSLTGHESEINLEGLLTNGVHEPEIAVIISKTAKERAGGAGDGLRLRVLDPERRELARPARREHNSQGSKMSKGLDTFSPFGPYITLKEDVPNPHNLEVYAVIDGVRHKWPVPNGNTSFLTFTVPEAIAYLSERMTLLPGDVISTGVPQPSVTFKEGQTAEIVIEGLGTLRNKVVSKPVPGQEVPARKVPGAEPAATH